MNYFDEFTKGIIKRNPVIVLGLGLCPVLAVSVSLENALWMSAVATFVMISSNVIISLLKDFIPAIIRIPVFMTIVTALVTVSELVINAYHPVVYSNLGIYLPLMVVNCIILGRAEEFASKNGIIASALDGAGYSLGFAIILVVLALIRETLGSNKFFGFTLINGFQPPSVIAMAPGAFFIIGLILWGVNRFNSGKRV